MEETSKPSARQSDAPCQLDMLKDELERLKSINEQLVLENQDLKNQIVDTEYERGYFVEEEVLQKLEEENSSLRSLLEDYYKGALKDWLEEVRKQIK